MSRGPPYQPLRLRENSHGIFGRSTIAKDCWKKAKKDFETKTGKKKPSKKFLGAIRKSSGLESAIDDLDQLALKVWDADSQKAYEIMTLAVQQTTASPGVFVRK